jgi:hypothetical protein
MRTTITLDPDVAAALEQLRRAEGRGMSEVVNDLVRAGLSTPTSRRVFVQQTADLGPGIDITNVAEALEQLEGPSHR